MAMAMAMAMMARDAVVQYNPLDAVQHDHGGLGLPRC
eukprot:COSAG02_NODE_129_length_34796_cov_26.576015_6_plen_37_part_00